MSVTTEPSTEAVVGHVVLDPDKKHDPHATRFGDFLKAAIKFEASDLLLKTGKSPVIRLRGALKPLDTPPVTVEEFHSICQNVLTDEQMADLTKYGSVDFAYDYDENNRFRVNLFQARGKISVAARLITSKIRRFEELYLPPAMSDIAMQPNGIVLLSGVTGSGKSTTIAAMLDYVNERRPIHIVTIEDPIEYIFKDKKATINQREIGIDCLNFKIALRALVRENPDVVLVGEMRDQETFEAALHAAETGHLVYGTIHASSSTQTFSRIYGLFRRRKWTRSGRSWGTRCERSSTRSCSRPSTPTSRASPASRSCSTTPSCASTSSRPARASSASSSRPPRPASRACRTSTGTSSSWWRDEYIALRVAEDSSPNIDEFRMMLKKLG